MQTSRNALVDVAVTNTQTADHELLWCHPPLLILFLLLVVHELHDDVSILVVCFLWLCYALVICCCRAVRNRSDLELDAEEVVDVTKILDTKRVWVCGFAESISRLDGLREPPSLTNVPSVSPSYTSLRPPCQEPSSTSQATDVPHQCILPFQSAPVAVC